jgi:glycine/D-amino acid oxidase-like deaminating enzyme
LKVEYLIIGQGICGTFFSWYLHKAKKEFIVADEYNPFAASRAAAGIINPVTGRRVVKTWMIDELMPFTFEAYSNLGKDLNIAGISEKSMISFFPSVQMKQAFDKKFSEDPAYLRKPDDENNLREYFNYDLGYGEIYPCYLVNLAEILPRWRKILQDENCLLDSKINIEEISVQHDHIRYGDITTDKIIFCDGIGSYYTPWFRNLPFAPNKGEALLIRIPGFPSENIYKMGMTLAPLGNDVFWVGASYDWDFQDDKPSGLFVERTVSFLKSWIKSPFEILDHVAAVRPATVERRPFVGFHPHYPNVGILNGMGTKGSSLAPYFAKQLLLHVDDELELDPLVDIKRYSKVLGKTFE